MKPNCTRYSESCERYDAFSFFHSVLLLTRVLSTITQTIIHPNHPLVLFSAHFDTAMSRGEYSDVPLARGELKGNVARVPINSIPVTRGGLCHALSSLAYHNTCVAQVPLARKHQLPFVSHSSRLLNVLIACFIIVVLYELFVLCRINASGRETSLSFPFVRSALEHHWRSSFNVCLILFTEKSKSRLFIHYLTYIV